MPVHHVYMFDKNKTRAHMRVNTGQVTSSNQHCLGLKYYL